MQPAAPDFNQWRPSFDSILCFFRFACRKIYNHFISFFLSCFLAFLLLNTPESVSETGKCANYSNPLPPAAPPLMTSHWVKNPRHPRISLPPPPPPASPGDGTEQQRMEMNADADECNTRDTRRETHKNRITVPPSSFSSSSLLLPVPPPDSRSGGGGGECGWDGIALPAVP